MAAIWIFMPDIRPWPSTDRDVLSVPAGADQAVHQHVSRSRETRGVGHELGERLPDHRMRRIPSTAHGGLADTGDRTSESYGVVIKYTTKATEPNKATAYGQAPTGDEPTAPRGVRSGHQLDELLSVQSTGRTAADDKQLIL
jgi:hypothetical protein